MKIYLDEFGKNIQKIGTDNGSEFQNGFDAVLKEKKIKHVLGSSYHPQSQAIAERVNRTMKRAIQKFLTNGERGGKHF